MSLQSDPPIVDAAMQSRTTMVSGDASPSFADQVRGQDVHAIDQTLARIMSDVYYGTGVDGWQQMTPDQVREAGIDPDLLHSDKSGFSAGLYTDSQGHYVVAYVGTDEAKDWLTNLGQGLGFKDAQYDQAIALAKQAKIAFGNEVVITGHSLGGGLAGAASIVSDIPAVTFNASGVHDNTLERQGLDAGAAKQYADESGLVRRYAVDNEILTTLQEDSIPLKWVMPDAVGHKIELPDPDPQSFWEKLVPGSGIAHGVDLHYIDKVIEAQQLAARQAGPAAAITDATHPGNALFNNASERLQPQRAQLGLQDDTAFFNTAATLAARADEAGMRRIDHVLPTQDGKALFAVQGAMDDPAHLRLQLDTAQARQQPLDDSAQQLQAQARTRQQGDAAEPTLRAAMTY
ncbi:XVIPCD domain-containing protein [Pseudoxanthomonas sp.]|uniref:XVIPCD domain-containing protein n=1 Tax=Pseudoxanthomonas sp. TaxID=1871049 RepID=UPI00262C7EE4|nr:XVIPCD domain-containing protein [Pseudoxanthomonas sp.]WDS36364.1 MAG: phospholipase [Pseudoxanthomonas sp.]